ncbi:MAG: class I SAM-dependent methyltransferase [Chloroflexi bacterium]|nr:class I SAM-dependent methyltransferase [Chloroflexota bacterium]
MHAEIAERLLRVNREFYQSFARPFAETRRRLQPGAAEAIRELPPQAAVLDLGCGSGEVARALARRKHRGAYLGIDQCDALLDEARSSGLPQAEFLQADLAASGWPGLTHPPYAYALAFAVLHHLPGAGRRAEFAASVRGLLDRQGLFVFSIWQFQTSERLRRRIVPWQTIGIEDSQVDPGDHLLDWRHGGRGLRYVHAFEESELEELARQTGFCPVRTYLADGQGGRLGRYEVWSAA